MNRFVICLQNHDQVGNRATGDRLHHAIDAAAWRAASAMLLTAPMTPLLFMGQEWAASSPFQYFTDLEPELGTLVTEGRRREFKDFPEFAGRPGLTRIPDPQDAATFERSRLDWSERSLPAHAASLALYTELLRLRNTHPALGASRATSADAEAVDADTIVMRREEGNERFVIVVRLTGAGTVTVDTGAPCTGATTVLTTEDPRFAFDSRPMRVDTDRGRVEIVFHRPGAVILAC
jgi:maltooligosyltrehalose trehalohydrolase